MTRPLGVLMLGVLLALSGAAATSATPRLEDGGSTVGGRITSPDGSGVAGIRVVLFAVNADGSRGSILGRTFTSADGDHRFEVAEGCYQLKAIAPDGDRFGQRKSSVRATCVTEGQNRTNLDSVLTVAPTHDPYAACLYQPGGVARTEDFRAANRAGGPVENYNIDRINGQRTFLRTVFSLDSDRMFWGDEGLGLAVDVDIDGPLDFRYRAEVRESIIDQPIPAGTTQAYCMRFRVDELPDLYGPITIFQRFYRPNDRPDISMEMTGANQFSNAVPNELQVVAWDGRHRIDDAHLAEYNTLLVVVYNHASQGAYKVVLNGRVLKEGSGLDTVGIASAGKWSQFGLYPHGLYRDPNRQDQIDSGHTRVAIEYADFTLVDYASGSADLSRFELAPPLPE